MRAQANPKEREKAKRARKEARKLEANPLQPATEDAVAWQPATRSEQDEVAAWVADRRQNFPTAATVARKREEAAALQASGVKGLGVKVWGQEFRCLGLGGERLGCLVALKSVLAVTGSLAECVALQAAAAVPSSPANAHCVSTLPDPSPIALTLTPNPSHPNPSNTNPSHPTSGGEGPRNERLFEVLQTQHKLGLLRSAGTEDIFRSLNSAARPQARGTRGGVHRSKPHHALKGASAARPDAEPASHGAQLPAESPRAQPASREPAAGAETSASADGKRLLDAPDSGRAAKAPRADAEAATAPEGAAAAAPPEQLPPPPASTTGERGGGRGGRGHGRGEGRRGGRRAAPAHGKPSLMERLVAADMRQDRSLLLQVFR